MKKRFVAMMCGALMAMSLLAGCGKSAPAGDVTVHVGGLKGPTSIGLLPLKYSAEKGQTEQSYEFVMATAADEITTSLVKGELDIALIPANVASVVYNKTEGKVSVIDINTLGVLYLVSGDSTIAEPEDLKGKTVYLTGKGTTPDYAIQFILAQNGIADDVTLEYKSEATEVAAVLAEDETAIGLLPQPFASVACAQNERLTVVMDITKEWDACKSDDSMMVTGVTLVRTDFLNEHEDAVLAFMNDHMLSAKAVNEDLDTAAVLAVAAEIIAKEQIAKKAIPQCNITYMDGSEMKEALSGYLNVLYSMNPESVGGTLPADDFYYEK